MAWWPQGWVCVCVCVCPHTCAWHTATTTWPSFLAILLFIFFFALSRLRSARTIHEPGGNDWVPWNTMWILVFSDFHVFLMEKEGHKYCHRPSGHNYWRTRQKTHRNLRSSTSNLHLGKIIHRSHETKKVCKMWTCYHPNSQTASKRLP